MPKDLFTSGVEPGGLTSNHEIRILVCYLLSTSKKPLSVDQINEILQRDGLVNYFELSCAIAELVQSNHIICIGTPNESVRYQITDLGIKTSETFARTLPLSVREKASRAAVRLLAKAKRDSENKVIIDEVPDGYVVTLRILNLGTDLMKLSLFVPDLQQAHAVRDQFLSDPELTYKGVIALLTGDLKGLGELVPSENAELYQE